MTRKEKLAARKASEERIAKAKEETRMVVETQECPLCGNRLRRNLALKGWWQCEQFGAPERRARPEEPGCEWQGFTD